MIKKIISIGVCLMLTVCTVVPAAAAGSGNGTGGASQSSEGNVRKPENPLAENVLKYNDVVEKGTPYDSSGLLTYKIENGSAVITSCDPAITGELYLPEKIQGYTVTAINDYAFLYCANMTAITIPDTVTRIGSYAFCYCTGLQSVKMGGSAAAPAVIGEHAFYRCYDLGSFDYGTIGEIGDYAFAYSGLSFKELKAGLKSIGDYAFEGCEKLTSLTLPDTLTSIGDFVFCECTALTSVKFPSSLSDSGTGGYIFYNCDSLKTIQPSGAWKKIPEGIFAECAGPDCSSVLKEGMTEIGDAAFYHCDSLPRNLVIPSTVTKIGDYALYSIYGKGVEHVTFPEGLKVIGAYNFYCASLDGVELPDSLEEIGDSAFLRQNITGKLVLGSNLKKIGDEAFSGINITELVVGENVAEIGLNAFYGCALLEKVTIKGSSAVDGSGWEGSTFKFCNKLTEINIPDTFTVVPPGFLWQCKLISSISIPEGVREIGERAFDSCASLTSVKLPSTLEKLGGYAFSQSALKGAVPQTGVKSIGAYAFSQTNITSFKADASLESIGEGAFSRCTKLGSIDLGKKLKSIGAEAFSYCEALSTAVLPGSVTSLGNGVFDYCKGMTSADISSCGIEEVPDDIFRRCSALESVKLPAGITQIGNSAFNDCTSLKSIDIPDSVEVLMSYTFDGCTSLKEIRLPSSLKELHYSVFRDCGAETLIIPESVSAEAWETTTIGYEYHPIFAGCAKLKNVNIPSGWTYIPKGFLSGATGPLQISLSSSITSIRDNAFYGCTGLTGISIPSSVTSIGQYAFYGSGLTSLTIPDSVQESDFGDYAAGGCKKLASIKLPSSWKSIPMGLLQGNEVMTSYTIPDGITSIGEAAFEGSLLTEIDIPDSVTSIGKRAFRNCTALKTINLKSSITELGEYAFAGCKKLETVAIPASISLIPQSAFERCSALKNVVIADGVKTINGLAFGYCDVLSDITIPDSVTQIAANAFYGSNPGNVHITTANENSTAAKHAAITCYVNSDWFPKLAGMTFIMSDYTESDYTEMKVHANSGYYTVLYNGYTYQVTDDTSNSYGYDRWISNYSLKATAEIRAYDKGQTAVTVIIPDYVPGSLVPVVGLNGSIFKGNTSLTDIKLGNNLETISNSAFEDCINLKSVDMSSSKISEISYAAFKGCISLITVKWPSTLTVINDSSFENCRSLTVADFSSTLLKKINAKAFYNCKSLSKLTLREGFSWIDNYAFSGTALTDVYIPASQYVLQPTAFDKNVTFHFTGDATEILYWWMNPADSGMYYSPVLPKILENRGSRVAQFFGKGLDKQSTYFISTASAGLNIPYGLQSGALVPGDGLGPAAGDPSSNASGELSVQSSGAQSGVDSESADVQQDGEQTVADEVYEVVKKTIKDNPLLLAAAAAVIIMVAGAAGVRRYRKSR